MKLEASGAILPAIGVGLGTYFGLAVRPLRRLCPENGKTGSDGDGDLTYYGCVGGASCPQTETSLSIDYRRTAIAEAEALRRIARAQMPSAKIRLFETTTLGG